MRTPTRSENCESGAASSRLASRSSEPEFGKKSIGTTLIIREIFHPRLVPWAAKGALAVTDQAFFAGTHFLLNVLLARWLTSAEYGVFALTYSVFVLFASLHSATFVEPMLVFGAGKYSDRLAEYFGILIRGHFLLLLPVSLFIAVVGVLIGDWVSSSVGHALLALAITMPFTLVLWMVRRAFYVELRPGWATFGAVLYLIVLLSLLSAMRSISVLSTVTALAMMSVGAVVVCAFLLLRLGPRLTSHFGGVKPAEVAASHWRYGRWSVAAAAAGWIPLNIYYLVLPVWFGLDGTAALRALMNLINPVLHFLVALGSLLLPTLVRSRRAGGKGNMNRTMVVSLAIFLSGSSMFSLTLWIFRTQAFELFYGGKYLQFSSGPLFFLLLSLLATCIAAVLGTGLMALEQPERNFWSFVASSIVALGVGVPLAALRGVQGATEGLLLSGLTSAGLMYFFYRRAESIQTPLAIGTGEYVSSDAEQQTTASTG
jgi:O-antigen/teichoic acid export membrane protein